MKYAVIKTGGKQYKVTEGDIIEIDRLPQEKGKVTFSDVLLLVADGAVKIGEPTVTGEKVEGMLLENIKGEKIRVSKYKSKVRYRRSVGFRAFLSKVQIDKIGSTTSKKEPAAKKK
ncbi:MAG: 50S ribosomal protein L21 [Candidatus Levybacteria bacterium]|nr:50S ribosomal protein L21 [Candidatus Levybacteria bacterium]